MKRTDFIKTLGLGAAAGLILPSNTFVSNKPIKIYDNYVRGLTHYEFRNIKNEIKEGDVLQLVRETENIYDSFAIQVNFGTHRLGYIAAYENIVLANLMDAGARLTALASQVDLERNFTEQLSVEIHADLVIPSQKLIQSVLSEKRADDSPDIYRRGAFGIE